MSSRLTMFMESEQQKGEKRISVHQVACNYVDNDQESTAQQTFALVCCWSALIVCADTEKLLLGSGR